jgi:IS30 family transposase
MINLKHHKFIPKTTMTKIYKQLVRDQRASIAALSKEGMSIRQIATSIGVNPSTVSRELKRNRCKETQIYTPSTATKLSKQRRVNTNKDQIKITRGGRLWEHIVEKMTIDNWSPQQIAGRMKVDWEKLHNSSNSDAPNPLEYRVSHETIYKWLCGLASNKDNKNDPNYQSDLELKNKLTLTLSTTPFLGH